MLSYYLLERLSRWVAERRSIFESVPSAKSINMLPMLENMSYCWLLMSIYIHDLMEIHRHILVLIYSVTKNFMFLGLTSVDFYNPYTDLGFPQGTFITQSSLDLPYTRLGFSQVSIWDLAGFRSGKYTRHILAWI